MGEIERYLTKFGEADGVESDSSGCRYAQHRQCYLHCLIHACGLYEFWLTPIVIFPGLPNRKLAPSSSKSVSSAAKTIARGVEKEEEDKVPPTKAWPIREGDGQI